MYMYHIRGTFGIDFKLTVWQIWLQSPNFMSTNTDYSQTIPFMSVFINPIPQTKCSPITLHSNSPNLMLAKCTAYTVCIYIFIYVRSLVLCDNLKYVLVNFIWDRHDNCDTVYHYHDNFHYCTALT